MNKNLETHLATLGRQAQLLKVRIANKEAEIAALQNLLQSNRELMVSLLRKADNDAA